MKCVYSNWLELIAGLGPTCAYKLASVTAQHFCESLTSCATNLPGVKNPGCLTSTQECVGHCLCGQQLLCSVEAVICCGNTHLLVCLQLWSHRQPPRQEALLDGGATSSVAKRLESQHRPTQLCRCCPHRHFMLALFTSNGVHTA